MSGENTLLLVLSNLIYLLLIFSSVIISVFGSIIIIRFLTRQKIDVREEIVVNRNIGIALVLGSFIWTLGRLCFETIKPIMNVWYSGYYSGFSLKSSLKLLYGISISLSIALLTGAITIYFAMKVLMVINKDINEWEEIKNGNNSVAIIISVTVIVIGLFFESILSTIITGLMVR
ncbi:MAG: hypothetical protein KAS97_10395 [Candidatus Aminicenantes bacterium]|nr:hypothetical protein [Candidatus Aminicenantes bacterium]